MRPMILAMAATLVPAGAPLAQEGKWQQADAHYDPADMREARRQVQAESGDQTFLFLQADRFEFQSNEGSPRLLWDAQGWYGGDHDKLWIKTEGEYLFDNDRVEEAELQALYSRAIGPYFDLQGGIRHDVEPGPSRTHAVVGIQGLAPQWFEVDAALFVSDHGDVTARIELEYELLFTQRLVLQPRAELNFSFQNIPELHTGSGLTSVEAGARLRYEIDRQIAPYLGVSWSRKVGGTADFSRRAGEPTGSVSFLAGIRLWY
jgi:copper resistance protein B